MKQLFHLILLITFTLFTANSTYATPTKEGTFQNPNFNYPQTVIKNADAQLRKALKSNDGETVALAIIQSSLSKSMITSDSLPSIISNIENVIKQEKNENIQSILYLLEAKIICRYYNINNYTLSQRDINDSNSHNIDDVFEWNTLQFKQKITELLDSALNNNSLITAPITTYPNLILINDISISTYPTLYDFVAYQAIDTYQNIGARVSWSPFLKTNITQENNLSEKVISLYDNIITVHTNDTPRINAILKKMNFQGENSIQQLEQLYQTYKNSVDAAPIILELAQKLNDKQKSYSLIKSYLKEFPTNNYTPILKKYISELETPKAELSFKQQYNSHDSITFTCEIENIPLFDINIYQLKDKIASLYNYDFSNIQPIHNQTFKINKEIIFSDTLNISVPPLPYGCYVAIIHATDMQGKSFKQTNSRLSTFIVSDIASFTTLNIKEQTQRVFAVNSTTGNPYQSVQISATSATKKPIQFSKKTNASGYITTVSDTYFKYNFKKGNDKYYSADFSYHYNNSIDESKYLYHAQVFTDLAIYRPGETLHMSAVCYRTKPDKKELLTNTEVEVSLIDASNETVTTVKLTTDDYGRIEYDFGIPTNRMNGEYNINLKDCSSNLDLGRADITVSEYKSPTFYIDFQNIQYTYSKEQKEITISGIAKTFSDIPVANTIAKCNLYITSFYGATHSLASIDTYTDENGIFTITLDTEKLINNTTGPYCMYKINATITDKAGETQYNNAYFSLGNSFIMNWDFYSYGTLNINANKKCTLPITIQSNKLNSNSDIPCTLVLRNVNNNIEKRFSFYSSNPTIDFSELSSGKYKLSAWIVEDSTARIDNKTIIIYRENDKISPVNDALWTPQTRIECPPGEVFNILLGSAIANNNIYYTISYKESVLKEGWKRLPKGISSFSYTMPNDANANICIQFYCIKNQELYDYTITVAPKHKKVDTNLHIESFRDKITAGDSEKWTINFTNNGKPVNHGAIIASLTDKAINSLRDNRWHFNPIIEPYFTINALSLRNSWINQVNSFYWITDNNKIKYFDQESIISIPEFNFYNQHFFSTRTKYRTRSNIILSKNNDSSDYSIVETGFGVAEDLYTESSQSAITTDVKSYGNDIPLRTSHIKTAFWKPNLVTDKNGNTRIEFIVPNYNTTWLFQAIGYDKDLETASLLKETISNKPIMVKPNLPRFLRQGDTVSLMASVQNATDSLQNGNASIELFNPINNEIILNKKYVLKIGAKGTDVVSIEYTLPDSITMLGFRIKATNGTHSDGEQDIIPVVQDISPVIESKPFYIQPGDNTYTIKLPSFPDNANVTLEYCDNPVWYVATALPSIQSNDNTTATQLAHSIFTNIVANKIANEYPEILDALEYWKENPQDSALISMLEKNSELKIGELTKSPFLSEAKKQTLRMSQLTDIFNDTKSITATEKLINKLKDLQLPDGGFTWFKYPGASSSTHITLNILQIIGKAKSIGGYINNDLEIILKNAIKYIDKTIIKQYNQQEQKLSYSGYLNYAFTRSLFINFPMSITVNNLYENIIGSLTSEWQQMNIVDKAFCAITLANFGKVEQAKPILTSINQFSIYNSTTGRYWDNFSKGWNYYIDKVALTSTILQAYIKVSPRSVYIDQIKEWLILEKQSNDWGNSSLAADAVYTILATGPKNLNIIQMPQISLNDNILNTESFDKILGYGKIKLEIDKKSKKNIISIKRNCETPAWGTIYSLYDAPMKNIKAASVSTLSIKKDIVILNSKHDTVKVGDEIQVRLTIKNSRDLEYITITDERAACLEPVNQTSEYHFEDGLGYYMEIKDEKTNLFFNHLPKGTHIITYNTYVTNSGNFSSGIATAQCQYSPQITAHSAGSTISVK